MNQKEWEKYLETNNIIGKFVTALENPYSKLNEGQGCEVIEVIRGYLKPGDLFFIVEVEVYNDEIEEYELLELVYNCIYFDMPGYNSKDLDKRFCQDCGDKNNLLRAQLNGNYVYFCHPCHKNNFTICNHCITRVPKEEIENLGNLRICKYCLSNRIHINKCKKCNKITIIENSNKYCRRCVAPSYNTLETAFNTIRVKRSYGKDHLGIEQFGWDKVKKVPGLKWFYNTLKDSGYKPKEYTRTFGFEFEVNAKVLRTESFQNFIAEIKNTYISIPNTILIKESLWKFLWLDYDGSLGNKGFEFKTVVLWGEIGVMILKKIVEILKKHFYTDNRCGLHLHLGLMNYSDIDINKAYYFYQRFQGEFKYFLDEKRLSNHYCKRITKKSKKELLIPGKHLCNDRYRAVNFAEITEFGTLEFRAMEGNLDIDRILEWLSINTKIMDGIQRDKYLLINEWRMSTKLKSFLGKELYSRYVEKQIKEKEKAKLPMKIGEILNYMFKEE